MTPNLLIFLRSTIFDSEDSANTREICHYSGHVWEHDREQPRQLLKGDHNRSRLWSRPATVTFTIRAKCSCMYRIHTRTRTLHVPSPSRHVFIKCLTAAAADAESAINVPRSYPSSRRSEGA